MKELFKPKNIAVVGASNKKGKIGYTIMQNLLSYKGKLYPINLKENTVLGKEAFKTILNIPIKQLDLIIIAVPAKFVASVLEEASKKKTKYAIIITAGFKEIGNYKGEEELIKIAKKHNIRLIGPNTLGIMDLYSGLDCLFLPENTLKRPKTGDISVISQSGTIGSVIIDKMQENNIGLNKFISYGNASDLNESDFLEYLLKDDKTKTIVFYVEEIKQGEAFFRLAKKAKYYKKKIILLKAGITEKGLKAVQSHTGALAGNGEIYKGIFKQTNIIQAFSLEDIISFLKVSNLQKPNKICVITNGGGYGILITDLLEKENINLFSLDKKTKERLEKVLPKLASKNNPIDIIGDANTERYINTITNIDADLYVVVVLGQTPELNKKEIDKLIIELKTQLKKGKQIIIVSTYKNYSQMFKQSFPTFEFNSNLAKALQFLREP